MRGDPQTAPPAVEPPAHRRRDARLVGRARPGVVPRAGVRPAARRGRHPRPPACWSPGRTTERWSGACSVDGAAVTCLLRSYPDSLAVAGHVASVDVICGDLAKLGPEDRFDAVVALDDLDRLTSVEADHRGWAEAFAQLLAAVRPGGALLLGVENYPGRPPARADVAVVRRPRRLGLDAGRRRRRDPAGRAVQLLDRLDAAGVRVDPDLRGLRRSDRPDRAAVPAQGRAGATLEATHAQPDQPWAE